MGNVDYSKVTLHNIDECYVKYQDMYMHYMQQPKDVPKCICKYNWIKGNYSSMVLDFPQ